MPGRKSSHTAKWDSCVQKVGAKPGAGNPYAICTSALGSGSFKGGGSKK